jgi:hypothetical protein
VIDESTFSDTLDLDTGLALLNLDGAALTFYWLITHRQEDEAFWVAVLCFSGLFLGPLALTFFWFGAAS